MSDVEIWLAQKEELSWFLRSNTEIECFLSYQNAARSETDFFNRIGQKRTSNVWRRANCSRLFRYDADLAWFRWRRFCMSVGWMDNWGQAPGSLSIDPFEAVDS
ncbi:hypothetical protein OI910_21510 [Pseudomonas aeruginosa]|nr:hypothetical protein OI910_21510 [Pseudomonas aeruginosa]